MAAAAACAVGALGSGAAAGARPASPTPTPVFAHTVLLAPVGGQVLVETPADYRFVRLAHPRAVPLGTLVDTTAGTVRLTSANPAPGSFQTGRFFKGIFRIEQQRSAGGLVNLVIRDHLSRSECTGGARDATASKTNKRVLGLLRGTAKGRFRTTGRFAAATVRGTDWGVRDRCDGTLTVVRKGVVVVSDFRLHRSVIVRAGQTYLAKAP